MPIHTFQNRSLKFIRQHRLVSPGDRLLVAVSGGPDSVALLHILNALKQTLELKQLTVVHFDHQLRGKASEQDLNFVESLAESLNLPIIVRQGDVLSYRKEHGLSLEMAARACRHNFFREVMEKLQVQKVALGHTADDQAEELLLRLLRGTGPAGMAGMLPCSQQGIIRPLLFASKAEIINYIRDMELSFRQDESNLQPFCQRNMLRLKILPMLAEHFHPQISQTLSRHANLIRDEEDYWAQQINSCWAKVCGEENSSRVSLSLPILVSLHPALLRRILRYAVERLKSNLFGFYAVHFEILWGWIFTAGSGKALQLPDNIWVYREAEKLVIARKHPYSSEPINLTITEVGLYDFHTLRVGLSLKQITSPESPPTLRNSAWIDADKIEWPLNIRSWQPGDRFRPLGLEGTKKLQDFFTDTKVPRSRRGQIPLLCDRKGICWLMGYRLDERVRVTAETRRILVVEFSQKYQ